VIVFLIRGEWSGSGGTLVEWYWQRGTAVVGLKPVSMPLYSSIIQRELARYETRTCADRSKPLTSLSIVRCLKTASKYDSTFLYNVPITWQRVVFLRRFPYLASFEPSDRNIKLKNSGGNWSHDIERKKGCTRVAGFSLQIARGLTQGRNQESAMLDQWLMVSEHGKDDKLRSCSTVTASTVGRQ